MIITTEQIVAHRGYQRKYPENTLLAVEQAALLGAHFIEVDIQFSKDGVPVLYHDASLQRVSGRRELVAELTARELENVPAYEPGRLGEQFIATMITTLEALTNFIQKNSHLYFYIELKGESIAMHGIEYCIETLSAVLRPVRQQCCLIAYNTEALSAGRRAGFESIGPILRSYETAGEVTASLCADVAFINKTRLPDMGEIDVGCPLVVYEVDVEEEARDLLVRGAARIETFAFAEMQQCLG